MSNSNDRPIWKEPAVVVGLVITGLAVGYFWYSFSHYPVATEVGNFPDKFTYLRNARPNEVGDALAGLAGSLALVWIVVTVWLQATELKEQRKELREQRHATEQMAEAQEKQVKLLEIQGNIFSREQDERRQLAAANVLNQILEEISWLTRTERELGNSWQRIPEHDLDIGSYTIRMFPYDTGPNLDNAIREIAEFAFKELEYLLDARSKGSLQRLSSNKSYYVELELRASEIEDMRDDLSEEQLARLRKVKFHLLYETLKKLISADVWVEATQGKIK